MLISLVDLRDLATLPPKCTATSKYLRFICILLPLPIALIATNYYSWLILKQPVRHDRLSDCGTRHTKYIQLPFYHPLSVSITLV